MRKSAANNDSKVVLPITPMLDMTFQLLFFFVANFNPADLEGSMDLALPSASDEKKDAKAAKEEKDVDKEAGADKDPVFEADYTIKVRTQGGENSDGSITDIAIRSISGKEKSVGADLKALEDYLTELKGGGKEKSKDAIKIQGDSRLRIKHVMEVMDTCRKLGYTNISFVKPEDFATHGR